MATGATTKRFTADFYCFEKEGDQSCPALADLLMNHAGGHADAQELETGSQEFFQLRSIVSYSGGNVFSAVFGRCRFGETPEQATLHGADVDVELKPGHGLVKKNHLLFFKDLNLIVFQRNGNAGRYSHLQNYLNKPTYEGYALVPVLTKDSYERLEQAGNVKSLEISVRSPAIGFDEENAFLAHYTKMFQGSNTGNMKLILSGAKQGGLTHEVRRAAAVLAKHGRTRVARAVLEEDNEVIDLIADRVVHAMEVTLLPSGRPDPTSMFAQLAAAKDACAEQLEIYFGP